MRSIIITIVGITVRLPCLGIFYFHFSLHCLECTRVQFVRCFLFVLFCFALLLLVIISLGFLFSFYLYAHWALSKCLQWVSLILFLIWVLSVFIDLHIKLSNRITLGRSSCALLIFILGSPQNVHRMSMETQPHKNKCHLSQAICAMTSLLCFIR